MQFSVDELVAITGAKVLQWPASTGAVQAIHDIDAAGPGMLYFPMRWFLRESVLSHLVRAGISAVVTSSSEKTPWLAQHPDLGVLSVENPPAAYMGLAQEARRRSSARIVGITGSSGKSTTREYLAAILRSRYRVYSNPHNRNRWSDCAQLLLSMEGAPDEAAVIEMGFGYPGDIDRLAALAQPHAGIITKVTVDHLDGGGTWERVITEKASLGRHLPAEGVMVLHAEDPGCARIDPTQFAAPVLTFGEGEGAHVRYREVQIDELGTTFTLQLPGVTDLRCRIRPVGAHQAANAAAASAVAHALGLPPAAIQEGLGRVEPLPRRFLVHRYCRGLTVIDDTFSNSVDAMTRGLETASHLAGGRRKIFVLTGIAQLEAESTAYHLSIGRKVAECQPSQILLVHPDERTAAIRAGAAEAGASAAVIEVDRVTALPEVLLSLAAPDTLIYCKASQFLWVGPQVDRFRAELAREGFCPADSCTCPRAEG